MSQRQASSVTDTHQINRDPLALRLLSHDLRAALSDIVDGTRLIDHADLPLAARHQLERVRSAGETLARLLESVLDLPVPGAAALVSTEILEFQRFLHDLEERWRGRAAAKGLGFRLKIGADVPPRIRSDRTALDRILSNLLANAIKFCPEGQVELCADIRAGDEMRLSVRDTGGGFSDEALRNLCTDTVGPGQSSRDGSGLGLHIAKSLAQAIGGQLQASNDQDSGAIVSLLLPAHHWLPELSSAHGETPQDLRGTTILFAEDNSTNQLLTAQMLATLGAEIRLANDGAEALDWLDRDRFDLALIDIEMPKVDGLSFLRSLRAREGAEAELPVLALTAYVLPEDRKRIYDAGANGILSKPIMDIASFARSIRSVLSPSTQSAIPEGAAPRLGELLAMTGPSLAPELLRRLLQDLSTAETGLQAAIETADGDAMRRHSHIMNSLAATLGAEILHTHTTALQSALKADDIEALRTIQRRLAPYLSDLRAAIEAEAARHTGSNACTNPSS